MFLFHCCLHPSFLKEGMGGTWHLFVQTYLLMVKIRVSIFHVQLCSSVQLFLRVQLSHGFM